MKKEEKFFTRLGRAVLFTVARFLMFIGFRTKIYYVNKSGRKSRYKGPCVFICNHTDLCDGILMTLILQYNNVHALVAKDWFERKQLNWILRQGRCYPIDRYTRDFSWLMKSMKALKAGESIVVFPEGGISRTGTMKPFKPGFVMLAQKAGVPVIPIATTEKYKVFGKRQRIVIDEPHFLEEPNKEHKSEYMNEQGESFRSRIEELQKMLKDGHFRKDGK